MIFYELNDSYFWLHYNSFSVPQKLSLTSLHSFKIYLGKIKDL